MADPDTAHGFVYTEDGYVNINASPYFDATPGQDYTVDCYIDRVYYQLAKALAFQLGVYYRSHPDYADLPLHPSYVTLQTLYRQRHPSDPSSSSAASSGIQSTATAEVPPVHSSGIFPRYTGIDDSSVWL